MGGTENQQQDQNQQQPPQQQQQTEGTQTIPPFYMSAPPQYTPGNHPMVYIPQFVPTFDAVQSPETESLVSHQGQSCGRSRGGCRRWGSSQSGCCMRDDGRSLGTFQNFVVGVLFGTFSPVLSLLMVYAMETSKLSRTGTLFGTANFFLMLAACISCWAKYYSHSVPMVFFFLPMVLGLIFLIASFKSFKWFLYVFQSRQNKTHDESVHVVSEIGTRGQFMGAFLIAFFFSFVGTALSILVFRRHLFGRYGAISGLGASMVLAGAFSIFAGHPPALLLLGMLILEFSLAHFQRAIVSAQTSQPTISA